MANSKSSKSNKTAHVLNLLTEPGEAGNAPKRAHSPAAPAVPEDNSEEVAQAIRGALEEELLAGLEEEPARFRCLFGRMKEAALAVAQSVCAELSVSDFTPAAFELGFGRGRDKALPPVEAENGVRLSLSGLADRVDQWEHGGKRYLRVVDYKTGKKSFDFSDVEDGAWYAAGIRWAAACGIADGYSGGLFGPGDTITREQLAVMLWRYAGSPAATDKELHFSDAAQAGGWSLDALRWAVGAKLISGVTDTTLVPKGSATRAQAASILMRFCQTIGK